ncbi:MAG: zinc ribbon domain-containing protein [Dehalococcoidia bacterium]|nr:zinc ribbon domain-containing protein [Dehalococcoidia bacterium]
MPIYEYSCPACDATYELQQSFSAETTHTCTECGKGTAKRVLHAPRVVFKGSGWYATDSRKSSSAVEDTAPAESTPAKPSETTSTSSSTPGADASVSAAQ